MKTLLIDLSAIVHPLFHVTGDDANPNAISDGAVSRVRSLATGHDRVVVCVERGKSFRCGLSDAYKAKRETKPASFYYQYDRAVEILEKDGYLVLGAPTFEADDVIATCVRWLRDNGQHEVTIATGDKDLCQLVGPGVTIHRLQDNTTMGVEDVVRKFGVKPAQMLDFLALVGDSSDNIQGAKNIGPKKAADLINKYGSLSGIYRAAEQDPPPADIQNGTLKSLRESAGTVATAQSLIDLRIDAPIDCAAILAEREQKPLAEVPADEPEAPQNGETMDAAFTPEPTVPDGENKALVPLADVKWEMRLQPNDSRGAIQLAAHLYNSRAFKGYGNSDAVLAAILAGREFGLGVAASLRGFCIIEGKLGMYADLAHALVLRSGLADYFDLVESDERHATWVTKRKKAPGSSREPKEVTLTYTLEEAKRAGLVKSGSAWEKRPAGQCRKQAKAELCRLVYPDIVGNCYDPEEF